MSDQSSASPDPDFGDTNDLVTDNLVVGVNVGTIITNQFFASSAPSSVLLIDTAYRNKTPNKTPRATRSFTPQFIILHEISDDQSLDWYSRPDVRKSYNYILDRTGTIYHYVDERAYSAWHTGPHSEMYAYASSDLNSQAIGIALDGPNDGTRITAEQTLAVIQLLQYLHSTYSIPLTPEYVVDHHQIDNAQDPRGYAAADLLRIPLEVSLRSAENLETLKRYLDATKQAKRSLSQIKIVFVGDGGVGKTSLIRRLQGFDVRRDEARTTGIAIQQIHGRGATQDLTYDVWDFGGQELLHATHTLFFTTRTIYVVVVDGRAIDPEQRLPYWMHQIQQRGGTSPVLLVVNKIDQYTPVLDKRGLLHEYRLLEEIVEVACTPEYASTIEELHTVLARVVATVSHIHDVVPASWDAVRRRLQAESSEYLPIEQVVALCEQEGIASWEDQQVLLRFLHDLGDILYFDDTPHLRHMGVLNPTWVTDGIYTILNTVAQREQRDGVIREGDIVTMLDGNRYPPYRQAYLLAAMERLELCWPLTSNSWLLPHALHPEQPELGGWDHALVFEYHYPSIPAGLLERLMVRLHSLIDRSYLWRSGMVIQQGTNRALLRKEKGRPVLRISVEGSVSERRRFLRALRFECDLLHQAYGLGDIGQFVPVPQHLDLLISYTDLLAHEAAGETHYFVARLRQRFSVRELLDGYGEAERPDVLSQHAVQDILDILHKRLVHLELQKAKFGTSAVPFPIANEIEETKKEIIQLQQRGIAH